MAQCKEPQTREVWEKYGLNADTPLTVIEQKFIQNYIRLGTAATALKETGAQYSSDNSYRRIAHAMLSKPNVQAEIKRIMEEIRKDTIATADEVMTYFTSVMRGEVKDQFGLEAPLAERTKAAQEIAKRTVDIENRKAGYGDNNINVTLNWG